MRAEMEGQQNGVRGAVEWGGRGHRLMKVCREVERPAKGKKTSGESELLETNHYFLFQMCKYERWDGRLADIVCKNAPHSRIPPVHQSHLMPQFYFQWDRSSIWVTHTYTHTHGVSATAAISSNELRQCLAQSRRRVSPYSHVLPLLLSSASSPLLLLTTPLLLLLPTIPFLHLYSFHLLINSLFPFPSGVISNFSLFFLIFLPLITYRSNWPLKVWEINFCARWLHRKALDCRMQNWDYFLSQCQ